jgi:hypothetical protein
MLEPFDEHDLSFGDLIPQVRNSGRRPGAAR